MPKSYEIFYDFIYKDDTLSSFRADFDSTLKAIDYMDDGSPIKLKITIDAKEGSAIFDFNGTGPEVYGRKLFYL